MSLTRTAEAPSQNPGQPIPFDGLSFWPSSFARETRQCRKVTTDWGPGGRRSPSRRKPAPGRLEPGLRTDFEIKARLSVSAAALRPGPHGWASTSADAHAHLPVRTSAVPGPGSCARTWNWPPEPRYAREERGVGGALRRAGLRGGRGQRWSALPTRGGGVANALELEPPSARYGNCICGLRNLQTLSLLTNQLLDLYDSATM